ncbi:MAG: type II secretion system F family protein [Mariniblastus sp.]
MTTAEPLIISTLMAAAAGGLTWASRDWVGVFLGFIQRDVDAKLKEMRIKTKYLDEYLTVWLYALVAIFLGLWFSYGSPIFAMLSVALLGPLPWYLLRRMAQRRREKIEEQLANSMTTLSGAIRAGLSLAQALEILAEQSPMPIKQEFQHMVGQYSMGNTLQETLEEAKTRLKSENFSMFAAAMLASRESGGRLNETVERIAESVREFQRLERKITAETAQARKSAVYMALAPFIILLVYFFVDQVNTVRLFTTLPGQIMLTTAIVLDLVAWLWARAILTPNI